MVKDKGRSEVSGLCRLRQTFAFRETQPGELHKWPSIALFGSFYGKMLCFYQFLPLLQVPEAQAKQKADAQSAPFSPEWSGSLAPQGSHGRVENALEK